MGLVLNGASSIGRGGEERRKGRFGLGFLAYIPA